MARKHYSLVYREQIVALVQSGRSNEPFVNDAKTITSCQIALEFGGRNLGVEMDVHLP